MNLGKIQLSKEVLSTSKVAKIFPENDKSAAPMTSISFSDTGEYCVTSAADDSLTVYNCREGNVRSTLYSKKYGVTLARFTHHKNNVIYASTKEDDTLRYLSIHDNKYIRYFRGHKKRVTAVEMSPNDDTVMTSSLDETVRLWDLRSSTCQGFLQGQGKTLAAFDPQGLVFAVATNDNEIRMYDFREYINGPFATWVIEDPQQPSGRLPEWTSLKFTADGKQLVITTVTGLIYIIDAFDGNLLQRLVGHPAPFRSSCGEDVCITPDAGFLVAGGTDSHLRVWDLSHKILDSQPFATLPTPHRKGINVVGFNPLNAMSITGGDELAFWLPSLNSKAIALEQ